MRIHIEIGHGTAFDKSQLLFLPEGTEYTVDHSFHSGDPSKDTFEVEFSGNKYLLANEFSSFTSHEFWLDVSGERRDFEQTEDLYAAVDLELSRGAWEEVYCSENEQDIDTKEMEDVISELQPDGGIPCQEPDEKEQITSSREEADLELA